MRSKAALQAGFGLLGSFTASRPWRAPPARPALIGATVRHALRVMVGPGFPDT